MRPDDDTLRRPKALFICGSLNQTTQMHQIAEELPEVRPIFSPYYGNRDFDFLKAIGALEMTIGGKKLSDRCLEYLHDHELEVDYKMQNHPDVELVFHCSDLVVPNNIRDRKVVLVQEGMTDPPSVLYPLVRRLRFLPGWLGGTSCTGLSDAYDRFCVASEGFRDQFVARGCAPDKIVVTGIPNFDDCQRFDHSEFPHEGFVLVCTSDVREVFWWEDRTAFIEQARRLAETRGKELIFKLHPNENAERCTREILALCPEAIVYDRGSAEEMVAKCDVLVCSYSSLAFVGLALGKEVHSVFGDEELARLLPLQNKCAAHNIADVGRQLLGLERKCVEARRGPVPLRQVESDEDHRRSA